MQTNPLGSLPAGINIIQRERLSVSEEEAGSFSLFFLYVIAYNRKNDKAEEELHENNSGFGQESGGIPDEKR